MKPSAVIAIYKAKIENQPSMYRILKDKRKYFLEAGYVTDRKPLTLRSRKDNEILIEIFEWASDKHVDDAHRDQKVREYWDMMGELCSEIGYRLSKIPEANESFAHFDALDIYD